MRILGLLAGVLLVPALAQAQQNHPNEAERAAKLAALNWQFSQRTLSIQQEISRLRNQQQSLHNNAASMKDPAARRQALAQAADLGQQIQSLQTQTQQLIREQNAAVQKLTSEMNGSRPPSNFGPSLPQHGPSIYAPHGPHQGYNHTPTVVPPKKP